MNDFDLDYIRGICEIKDIGYSQSSNQFTSFSIDRTLLRQLLSKYDELAKENESLRKLIEELAEALRYYADRMDSGGTARRALKQYYGEEK
jgi:hypothetical protein